jgi:hypothetical protein
MKDSLILLLQEHLMSKLTHHSQPQAASDPFSTAPPPQLNAFPASGHISQPLVASSVSAEHFASQDFNKSAGTSTRPQPHNITSQPHAAPEQLATQQQGISQLAQHSATVLNIPAICDSKIQIDATTLSLCTNPEQSSSPQTLPDELLEVLELGEEADKLSSMRDYHAAEQCYLHALKILPQHAQSLCNYAHLLHTGKKELDKAEGRSGKLQRNIKAMFGKIP